MDRVFQFDDYRDVKIVHISFPNTCDDYEMQLQGQSGIERRVIQCI